MANWGSLIKGIELLLTFVILILLFDSDPKYEIDVNILFFGSFYGYILVICFFTFEIMEQGSDIRGLMYTASSAVGCVLFLMTGGLLFAMCAESRLPSSGKVAATSAMIIAIIFLIEVILHFVNRRKAQNL